MELPKDFAERIKCQLGDAYEQFLAGFEKERVFGLRYNPLKIEKDRLASFFLSRGTVLENVPWAQEGFYYPGSVQPGKMPLHEAGAYYIQEPSAMAAAACLDPEPGERVLDLCAAPGGKSTHIAGRMQGKGFLLSNEVAASRAKILSQNMERMGVSNAAVLNETPERLAQRFPAFFDKILADAPCSGEGMFRKDWDACGQWSLDQVEKCAKRQKDILHQAAEMLRPGGVLVYSTCTFAPEENEENAEWFVCRHPQFVLEYSEQIWPHLARGEGHYLARFRKEGTSAAGKVPAAFSGKGAAGQDKKLGEARRLLEEFCRETLSQQAFARIQNLVAEGCLTLFGSNLYLVPPEAGSLAGLKTERAGLHMGCLKKNRFEPAHAFAMALRPEDVCREAQLDEADCRSYIRGEAAGCSGPKGWTLVTVEGCSVGWGKVSQGVLKNHYPKGLRKNLPQ